MGRDQCDGSLTSRSHHPVVLRRSSIIRTDHRPRCPSSMPNPTSWTSSCRCASDAASSSSRSEIYGGTGSVWDYGPLGVELKKNLKDRWWKAMVRSRDDIEGIDAAILMHPRVWEASGHVGGLRRSARRLQDVQGPLSRRQARGRAVSAEAVEAAGRAHGLPAHRAAAVQPHVQDVHGAGRGDGVASSTCARRRRRASS